MKVSKRQLIAGLTATATLAATASTNARPIKKGQLSNPRASSEARALYQYLNDVWGKKTLTGQQESNGRRGPRVELDYIQNTTGKLPAVLGLDYITPSDRAGVNDRATAWYQAGGIPTICWHWGNPMTGPGYESSKTYFNAPAALQMDTPEHAAFLRDMDEIAADLLVLQQRRIPVLWRPYHEFTGKWFWWGMSGPETFKRLWVFMHDRFTHYYGINNLIWVLGYTKDPSADYFPGRQYVDIVGADNYVSDHGAMKDMYDRVRAVTGDDLPIALHECGPIPDPDLLQQTGANWLYFLTWHSEFVLDGKTNPPEFLKSVYNSARYITRDKVPPLPHYATPA